ncbi:MAG: hypothetical protein KGL35_08865 [Bradyrhizobium sp.]|nr:hypothetical protein [Bradyrhizobium sp.]
MLGMIDRARKTGASIRGGIPRASMGFVLPGPRVKATRAAPSMPARDIKAPDARRKDDGTLVDTMDLRPCDCRWPHGDPHEPDFHYCANPKWRASPYCEYHAARAIGRRNGADATTDTMGDDA